MENLELDEADRDVVRKLNQQLGLSPVEKQEEKESIRCLMGVALKLAPEDLHALGISKRQVLSLTSRLFLGFRSFIPANEDMILKAVS